MGGVGVGHEKRRGEQRMPQGPRSRYVRGYIISAHGGTDFAGSKRSTASGTPWEYQVDVALRTTSWLGTDGEWR